MLGLNARGSRIAALFLVAAAGTLVACSDDMTTTTASSSSGSSSSGSSSSGGEGGAGGKSGAGGGGGSMCVPGPVAAKTIKGTITYGGAAAAGDTLRIAAFKDSMPGAGAPAALFNSPAGTAPVFPFAYELTINQLPPEGTGMYGVFVYLDIGSDDDMGPDMAEDPGAMPSMEVVVDDCKGATVDITLMDPP